MLLKSSLRWVAPLLQHECGHRHTSQRLRSNCESLKIFFVFFASNPACALGYVSGAQTHAWGGPGLAGWLLAHHRCRGAAAAQFRARLGRRARFLIAVYCCARWLHARRRAHSVCKQTLREPQMCRPARALISALSWTPRASLGTLSSRPKTLGRLKDVCAS